MIIRHGETALNVDGKIRGWSDVPLNSHGFAQAEKLGKELKGKGIDYLVSSDLTRTLQTAQTISVESGIPVIATSMSFRPLNVGKYTGELASKVHPMIMRAALEEPDEPVGGGESFDSFRYRVLMGLVAFLNEYDDCVLGFVCHHRNDRLIRGWVEAGCPSDFAIDMTHFLQHGIDPGTADTLTISSPLIHNS